MKTKSVFFVVFLISFVANSQPKKAKTSEEIINLVKKNINCTWSDKTVDTFKSGNPNSEVKGIVVCMFADMYILREAVKTNCNLIITHEPVFFNHNDENNELKNDPVYIKKKKYIDDNHLVIFRFHDHIHSMQPDGISVGMIRKMDLKSYSVNGSLNSFIIPETSVVAFANEIKRKSGASEVRIIGNKEMRFTKLAFMAGAPGGQNHIRLLGQNNVEVLIGGEAPEWETYSYVIDAVALGDKKAVIFLGHIKSEESGMEYCAEWLRSFITNVPVHFIENKDNYSTF